MMRARLTHQVHKLFGRVPLVRAIGHWRSDRLFRRWRARNPGATYADYYAASVSHRMRQGRAHYTLGPRGWTPGHGPAVEWDADSFAERGMRLWHQIRAFGLEPYMRCVDYGCGSLRLGQHAIRYLDPGNYWGVDVVETFIEEGIKFIGPELLSEKRPRFGVIDDFMLAEIGRWEPDFIFSNAVLQHVPPDELGVFFERLAKMMAPRTRAYVLFISAGRQQRVKAMNWAYPADDLLAIIARAGLSAKTGIVDPCIRRVDGRDREVLEIRRLS